MAETRLVRPVRCSEHPAPDTPGVARTIYRGGLLGSRSGDSFCLCSNHFLGQLAPWLESQELHFSNSLRVQGPLLTPPTCGIDPASAQASQLLDYSKSSKFPSLGGPVPVFVHLLLLLLFVRGGESLLSLEMIYSSIPSNNSV